MKEMIHIYIYFLILFWVRCLENLNLFNLTTFHAHPDSFDPSLWPNDNIFTISNFGDYRNFDPQGNQVSSIKINLQSDAYKISHQISKDSFFLVFMRSNFSIQGQIFSSYGKARSNLIMILKESCATEFVKSAITISPQGNFIVFYQNRCQKDVVFESKIFDPNGNLKEETFENLIITSSYHNSYESLYYHDFSLVSTEDGQRLALIFPTKNEQRRFFLKCQYYFLNGKKSGKPFLIDTFFSPDFHFKCKGLKNDKFVVAYILDYIENNFYRIYAAILYHNTNEIHYSQIILNPGFSSGKISLEVLNDETIIIAWSELQNDRVKGYFKRIDAKNDFEENIECLF